MLNTEIQAPTRNVYGLMATPAALAPCLQTDQNRKPVIKVDLTRPRIAEPTPCHMYPGLCTTRDGEQFDDVDENGRHIDHGSDAIGVPGLEVEGDPEIWANFIHLSASTPKIGFMGHDLTPEQARTKARELRQFADELDDLADQTATACALHDVRTVRETASPAFAGILTIVENAIARDGADPAEVFERVLELMNQARDAA
ncbi:hypothetical protein [Streptomyces caniscabiei]|uniref:hypothetical protein n=1 Tax=Streptomyces caniscabiei TaxID=2746961 RepID=UPI001872986B|nr:hypothetical protein [Streptomyces caniscabiei]MBE4789932.1 hypothetical protein [Streptomyces caniscabiei]MBE4799724.1 hypothetical protein [Streptomyces caniscabiei]